MDAVEDIKQRLSIEDVVGEYVELKRAGRNLKGLSPFSSERTPSFMVSPEKQIWHDFSSGKGGSMFGFVMEMEGVDFKGALEILARKAGVDLDQYRGSGASKRGKEKERLYEALDWAAKFYQSQLKTSAEALDYLRKRQFKGQTIIEWRLGYSPAGGSDLVNFLRAKKFSNNEIKSAGLGTDRFRRMNDMFRGRLMIPLCDQQGRVIGFTARLLADNPDAPKYINTPQTWLYDKSRHIFGLHLAKDTVRRCNYVVVAEGNLDVIMSHQASVRQVVATAGTALTESHLKELRRFTGDIRLSFDADKAGLNATERAIPIASKADVHLSIITIPAGKDPDELIKHDRESWLRAITSPQYVMDWYIEHQQKELDITTAVGKQKFTDKVLPVVLKLEQVERSHYLNIFMKLLGLNQGTLDMRIRALKEPRKELRTPSGPLQLPPKIISEYTRTQDLFMALMLQRPELRQRLQMVTTDMLLGDPAKELHVFLAASPDSASEVLATPELQPVEDYVKILLLQYEELYDTIEPNELHYEAARLQVKLIDQFVKMQKQRLAHQLQHADEAETKLLLEQVKRLDYLLKTHKGRA
ncbi:MAG TPA: DNA primase [Candidatus Saccharimonadales bacterium]